MKPTAVIYTTETAYVDNETLEVVELSEQDKITGTWLGLYSRIELCTKRATVESTKEKIAALIQKKALEFDDPRVFRLDWVN